VQLFGYALVPTAIPGAAGLRKLFTEPAADFTGVAILTAAALFAALFVACLVTARRGAAAAVVLLGDVLLAVMLARNGNDFGLFKLYMYIQPFIAAAVAVWLSGLRNRRILVVASALLAVVCGFQLSTMNAYVDDSRDPIDLRGASEPDLLPKFRHSFAAASEPLVSVTDNYVLAPLQGASVGDKPLYFVSRNVFNLPWKDRRFPLASRRGKSAMTFGENPDASRLLSRGSCEVLLPTGSQLAVNRRALPEGAPQLIMLPCSKVKNLLVFVVSSLGQPATVPLDRTAVSFWQLESDPVFAGRTFSGFGRYALFQILGATAKVRVALEFTTSFTQRRNGSFQLPRAAMAGATRVRFPIVGSGSARVFSPPVRPRLINGRPYVVLDMGRNGEFPLVPRPGVAGLWGESVTLDPRTLTSYVRDVSLVSAADYGHLQAPSAIRSIPADLANRGLEYSGIYEDGWVGKRAYARLAGGPSAPLVIRTLVLPRRHGQTLQVLVNGRVVDSRRVKPGVLELGLPLAASRGPRTVELRWAGVTRLSAQDRRSAAARLMFLGVAAPPLVLRSFPSDIHDPALLQSGIYDDGWVERESYAVLAGGEAGTLVVRADVPARGQGQHLRVLVNGRSVASRNVTMGEFELHVPIAASRVARRVELHWAGTVPLRAPDTRRAAAHLTFLGIADLPSKINRFPTDLKDPALLYSGIFEDGWLAQRAEVVLAGGDAANLVVRAQVAATTRGQHLRVLVNGRPVAARNVPPGELEVRVPLALSDSPRRIELRWTKTARLSDADPRRAAALLRSIAIDPARPTVGASGEHAADTVGGS
jgi:hypothetical protein